MQTNFGDGIRHPFFARRACCLAIHDTQTSVVGCHDIQIAFKALDLGASAAQSVVLMFIVVIFTVIQFRFVEKKVNY